MNIEANRLRRIQVDVRPDLHKQLRIASVEQGISASAIVRALLEAWATAESPDSPSLAQAYEAGMETERRHLRAYLQSRDGA